MTVLRVMRPEVMRRVPLDRHGVVEASAGTGKTFTLENLVVELVLATDVTMDGLLCVTFTEKATHELRTRVRAKLEALLSGRAERATESQLSAGDYWTIDSSAIERLTAALHTFDRATITTIHAFCHRVLRENAFASGRCFQEEQIDGREAFGRALRVALRTDVSCDPARAQWLEAALRAGWSIERIEKLLWGCVQAHGELRPRFDPEALEAALEAFPIDEAREPRLLHEFKTWGVHAKTCGTLVSALSDLADLVERARSAGGAPVYVREAKDVVGKLRDRLPQLSPRPGRGERVCCAALDLVRATPPFAGAIAHALFGTVRDVLEQSKRAAGRYDFDDMLSLVEAALGGTRGQALAQAMRRRWRYVLIDEFQDTDQTQWSIFRRAFFDVGRGSSPSRVVLVGDPKQSIYRFRGADVDTYLLARSAVVASGGANIRLENNYRSTPHLVEAINRFFDPNATEPIFTGDVGYAPVGCGRPDRALVDGDGHPLAPICALKFTEELSLQRLGEFIAREVQAATDSSRPWRFDGRALEYRDAFVLTRTQREGHVVGASLRAAGVPYAFYKEEGLYQSDEAKDLRALLYAIEEPDDHARRMAAWLTPFFGLPLEEIERARGLPAAHPLVAKLYAWKALADTRDFDRLFRSIISESGIVRREIFWSDSEREITNYLHLIEALVERAHGAEFALGDLIDSLSGLIGKTRLPLDLEGNVQRVAGDRSAVQIMTIHKAKGLEAPLVFLASGRFSSRSDDVRVYHEGGQRLAWVGSLEADIGDTVKREEAEEDQRLMYVALTRAMGRLYLPYVVDSSGASKSLRGPYDRVSRRVAELVRTDDAGMVVEDMSREISAASAGDACPGPEWQPPAALLHERDDRSHYESLTARHAAPMVTSYTRMRAERGPGRSSRTDRPDDRRIEKSSEAFDSLPGASLRSARASGVFLHQVLERVLLSSFSLLGGFEAWRKDAKVTALFDEGIASYRVDPAQREHAERLVWTAYTTPIVLPSGDSVPTFASAERVVREMEFVYPIPEPGAPSLDRPAVPPSVARGYVRGSLDLAFEHRGLTYFADWKSDSLASYGHDDLARHVVMHYEEQAKLYALAIVRLLGVRSREEYEARFGGLLYCFLRGFGPRQGLWSARPTWDEVLAWDDDLRTRRDWGARRGR